MKGNHIMNKFIKFFGLRLSTSEWIKLIGVKVNNIAQLKKAFSRLSKRNRIRFKISLRKAKRKNTIIICIDPGKLNYGFSIMDTYGKVFKYGMISNTITILKGRKFSKQKDAFLNEIKKTFNTDKYTILIIERFMNRGMLRGNTGECTLIMMGLLIGSIKGHTILFTAAQWKNFFRKEEIIFDNKNISDHIRDSISMGLYFLVKERYIKLSKAKKIISELNEKHRRSTI